MRLLRSQQVFDHVMDRTTCEEA